MSEKYTLLTPDSIAREYARLVAIKNDETQPNKYLSDGYNVAETNVFSKEDLSLSLDDFSDKCLVPIIDNEISGDD